MTNKQLSAEILEEIELKAEHEAALQFHPVYSPDQNTACRICYRNGAKEYATQVHWLRQENLRLTNWQHEAKAILNPIWDYADTLNVPLGESKTEAITKHINEAKKLLTEVFQKHESGLLPDRFIYEKIKTFLYGE